MAQKLPRKGKSPAGSPPAERTAADKAVAQLQVLHPERAVTLNDRTVEVREYGYIEGLRMQLTIQPFLDALFALCARSSKPPPAEAVRSVFGAHVSTVHWMIAQAITPAADEIELQEFVSQIADNAKWVATLNDLEGDALLAMWWGVNGGFFTRRLRERILAQQTTASPSHPDGSTPP